VFQASAAARLTLGADGLLVPVDRAGVLSRVADQLGATPEAVENGLFADLKSEQRLTKFKDLTAQRLLQRYNVALAQAVLLRAHKLQVVVRGEAPPRYRHLLRRIKFHRLICEVERLTADSFRLHLDGPLSLFSATQRYGLQLALFLPTVLLCRDFEVRAEIRWGPQKKLKFLLIGPGDGLVSHDRETGCYTPPELQMFVDLFRKRITDWELHEDAELVPLDGAFWAPDFRLRHVETGREVLLEILGFWRRSGLERHLQRLRRVNVKFLLAVSDQLHIEEDALESLPAGVHRFRNMPLPDEIARLATAVLEDRP
jgi:predicted nuclease of restriction endonuclease-like RecB superfamily